MEYEDLPTWVTVELEKADAAEKAKTKKKKHQSSIETQENHESSKETQENGVFSSPLDPKTFKNLLQAFECGEESLPSKISQSFQKVLCEKNNTAKAPETDVFSLPPDSPISRELFQKSKCLENLLKTPQSKIKDFYGFQDFKPDVESNTVLADPNQLMSGKGKEKMKESGEVECDCHENLSEKDESGKETPRDSVKSEIMEKSEINGMMLAKRFSIPNATPKGISRSSSSIDSTGSPALLKKNDRRLSCSDSTKFETSLCMRIFGFSDQLQAYEFTKGLKGRIKDEILTRSRKLGLNEDQKQLLQKNAEVFLIESKKQQIIPRWLRRCKGCFPSEAKYFDDYLSELREITNEVSMIAIIKLACLRAICIFLKKEISWLKAKNNFPLEKKKKKKHSSRPQTPQKPKYSHARLGGHIGGL